MAALWESGNDGAQTHVLVIAIGGYLPRHEDSEAVMFKEYSTIARTGLRVLDWVFDAARQFDPYLGSVFAAISDPREGTGSVRVSTPISGKHAVYPTLGNLKPMVREFLKKLDGNPGNTGLVYFCGHGIARHDGYLLSADWGTDPEDPLFGLINIDGFSMLMRTKKAGRQLVIADCCQEFNEHLDETFTDVGAESFGRVFNSRLLTPSRALIQTAQEGGQALAEAQGVTHFCDVFLRAMAGEAASADEDQVWRVTLPSLVHSLKPIAARLGLVGFEPIVDSTYPERPVLTELEESPEVEVRFKTDPKVAIRRSKLAVTHVDDGDCGGADKPSQLEVTLPLRAQGGYIANATFDRGLYQDRLWPFTVQPLDNPIVLQTPEVE